MVCLRGESLTHHLKHMKLSNTVIAAAVIGASLLITAIPVSAQYYGTYGNRNNPYDNHRRRYDVNPHHRNINHSYTIQRRNSASQTVNSYMRKNNLGLRYIR